MPFQIVHNDITKMNTDIIVNAANSALQPGGGVCGAIFRAAGIHGLAAECQAKAPCSTGSAVITGAYDMPVRYIVHAVGPVWHGGGYGEREQLAGAYRSALELAVEYQCQSIAFPLISAGIYGYPKEQALAVAVSTISEFLLQHDMDVYLVVFDRSFVQLSEKLFADIRHYIDTYYVPEPRRRYEEEICRLSEAERSAWIPENTFAAPMAPSCVEQELCAPDMAEDTVMASEPESTGQAKKTRPSAKQGRPGGFRPQSMPSPAAFGAAARRDVCKSASPVKSQRSLQDLLSRSRETFSEMLLRLIDEKGYTDVEVYKRANMDRKLFSKIRSNKDYHPKKATVFALAIALRLSVDEATDLLRKAGYTFSDSYKQDIIVRYFLERREYDMFTINETLFCFEEPLLGA